MKTREQFIREARKKRNAQLPARDIAALPHFEEIGRGFCACVEESGEMLNYAACPGALLLTFGVARDFLLVQNPEIVYEVWYSSNGVYAFKSSIEDAADAYWRAVECRRDQLRKLVDLRAAELAQLRKALAEVEIML